MRYIPSVKYDFSLQTVQPAAPISGFPESSANAKAVALLGADTPLSRNTIRIGAEWNMSKNYGGGLLYDVTRPFTDLMSSHPRRYDALPALHRLSAFLEDNTTITAGEWRIEIMAGLRTTAYCRPFEEKGDG